MHRLLRLMLSLILVVGLIPGTMIAHAATASSGTMEVLREASCPTLAAVNATVIDITIINLTGNYQYGTVPAGILPAFNPGTTTDGITIDKTNSD